MKILKNKILLTWWIKCLMVVPGCLLGQVTCIILLNATGLIRILMNSWMLWYVLECKPYSHLTLAKTEVLEKLNLWNMVVWLHGLNGKSSHWICIGIALLNFRFGNQSLDKILLYSYTRCHCHVYEGARGINEESELSTVLFKHVGEYLLSENHQHLSLILEGIHNFIALEIKCLMYWE